MNYFEIINKCLVELNYKEVSSWDALTLNDHKRLKDIVARLNSQICASFDWPFLQRTEIITIEAETLRILNPVTGRLDGIFIGGEEYTYSTDYKSFVTGSPIPGHFASYGEYIYLTRFSEDKECQILYCTDNSAYDTEGTEKKYLEAQTDKSLIQEAFQENLLVYGSCMRLKANPEHNKFKYWYSMYTDALATMRSMSIAAKAASPNIVLKRG